MAGKRRRFSAEFKARVVRAALREDKTLAELAGGGTAYAATEPGDDESPAASGVRQGSDASD